MVPNDLFFFCLLSVSYSIQFNERYEVFRLRAVAGCENRKGKKGEGSINTCRFLRRKSFFLEKYYFGPIQFGRPDVLVEVPTQLLIRQVWYRLGPRPLISNSLTTFYSLFYEVNSFLPSGDCFLSFLDDCFLSASNSVKIYLLVAQIV